MNKIQLDEKLDEFRITTEGWRSELDENKVTIEFLACGAEFCGKISRLIVAKASSLFMQLVPESVRRSSNSVVLDSYNRLIKENMLLSLHETAFMAKEQINSVIGDDFIESKNIDFSKYALFSQYIAFLEALVEANKQKNSKLAHLIGEDVVQLHTLFEQFMITEDKQVKYELLALDSKFHDTTDTIFTKIHTLNN